MQKSANMIKKYDFRIFDDACCKSEVNYRNRQFRRRSKIDIEKQKHEGCCVYCDEMSSDGFGFYTCDVFGCLVNLNDNRCGE